MCRQSGDQWDEYAPIYLRKMDRPGDRNLSRILPAMLSLCEDDLNGQEVLDLACGAGHLSFALEERGAKVVGVDMSEVLIEAATKEARQRSSCAQFTVGDARDLPFDPDRFDLVLCNMSLQDIEDANAAIGEAARVGKSGARGLFSVRHPFTDGCHTDYLREQMVRVPLQDGWRDSAAIDTYPPLYHRPLSFYVNALLASGFTITRCEEVTDREGTGSIPLALVLAGVLHR